jgi:1-acyl-sn-glycerol-3-phosphate acyltransferase
MTTGLRFFYRHIQVTGLENVPAKGPVIIIANHASSLMDAALLGILLKRPAYFFARGDVFINKAVQKTLSWFHMMPVHNHEAGRHTLEANNDSFSEGQKILSAGGIVVFFPESTSHTERQLLPFRKGIFRIAFKTAADNNFSFEIPVIPVGITYEHPVACRTEVQVHACNPMLLSAYKDSYKENPAATLLHISKDAWLLMGKKVLHIENKNRLQTAEYCLIINRNNYPAYTSSWKIKSAEKLQQEQMICQKINSATETEFENIQQQSASYFDELVKYRLDDKTIAPSFSFTTWKKILLWAGFPFYLTGLILNGLPVLIARLIADKKVYRADFYSWIFVVCYSFLYFFWLIILLASGIAFGWQYGVALLAVMILTGIFSYLYKDWLKEAGQKEKLKRLTEDQFNHLRKNRDGILKGSLL